MPPSYLSPSQRETLAQFESITARNDERSSLEALERTGWNLEAAITQVYDGSATQTSYPPTPASGQEATVDERLLPSSATTSNGSFDAPSPRRRTTGMGTGVVGIYYLRQALAVPIHILSWPLSIVYNLGALVLGFLARLIGFRLSTSTFHPRNPFSPSTRGGDRRRRVRTILSPAAASQKWVDSVHRLVNLPTAPLSSTTTSTGIEVGTSAAGSSTMSSRRNLGVGRQGERLELPEFFVGGYEQALRKARDELRLLMVILTCEEHEQDESFKREVLTDPELVKSLGDEKVIVWGGDVMDRDAYQVGRTLSYTALPFIAFISLQPTASTPASATSSTSSSSSSPRLSLVSRIEPLSTSLPTVSASYVHSHLHSTVIPKTSPYLSRLLSDQARREEERVEREARDQRANEVARRDEERILGMRRAREVERREQVEKLERIEKEKAEFERRRILQIKARRWRRTKRAEFEKLTTMVQGGEGIRVVVRLGNGKRVMRRFSNDEPVSTVYEWVECELGKEEDEAASLGEGAEEEVGGGGGGGEYVQKFAFKLATTFPRQLIQLPRSFYEATPSSAAASGRTSFDSLDGTADETVPSVGEAFAGMGKDVSLVVDGLEERRRLSMSSRDDDDDDDEEEEEEEGV